jgi:hypothetical protein
MWCFPIVQFPTLHSECHSPLHKLSTALWRLILSDTALCHPRAAVAPRFKRFRRLAHVHCSQCHVHFTARMNCPWLVKSATWCSPRFEISAVPFPSLLFITEIRNIHVSVACVTIWVFRTPTKCIS